MILRAAHNMRYAYREERTTVVKEALSVHCRKSDNNLTTALYKQRSQPGAVHREERTTVVVEALSLHTSVTHKRAVLNYDLATIITSSNDVSRER
jgi:hypothetical protein